MAQSILAWLDPRQTISYPCGFVHRLAVAVADLPDVAAALARIDRIVAGRQLANDRDHRGNAPTVEERGCRRLLLLFGAGAPHKDAGARITAA